jgi:hypothetical protein
MAFILFRSQYQCGAILSADVCVEVVCRLSVGRNQDYVPACCIILRYKLHYLYRGMIGTYMHGIIQWSAGSSQCVRVLPVVVMLSRFCALDYCPFTRPSGGLCMGGVLACVIRYLSSPDTNNVTYTSELYNMQVHNLDFSPQTTYAPLLHTHQPRG